MDLVYGFAGNLNLSGTNGSLIAEIIPKMGASTQCLISYKESSSVSQSIDRHHTAYYSTMLLNTLGTLSTMDYNQIFSANCFSTA